MGAPGSPFPIFSKLLSVYEVEIRTMGGFSSTLSSYSQWAGIGLACKVHNALLFHILLSIHAAYRISPQAHRRSQGPPDN